MRGFLTGLVAAIVLIAAPASLSQAWAAPKFPALSGRVVDGANMLSPKVEQDLTDKLAGLESTTKRQLVVVTVKDLQGYEIEDYGYQLGRAWGIGSKEDDNGVLFLVAPKERKVRIEVGYGLEPILTDALSSTILQGQVIPRFKAGDMEGGVVAGANAIIDQLAKPESEAIGAVADAAAVAQAAKPAHKSSPWPFAPFIPIIVIFIIFSIVRGLGRRGRRGGGLGGGILPWIVLGALENASRNGRHDGWGGGGGGGWSGGGGGGFSGGGGSFGGGGSSGSW